MIKYEIDNESKSLWDDTLRLLTQTHNDLKMEAFLKELIPVSLKDETFTLASEFAWPANKIMTTYKNIIEEGFKEITFDDISLNIIVDPDYFESSESNLDTKPHKQRNNTAFNQLNNKFHNFESTINTSTQSSVSSEIPQSIIPDLRSPRHASSKTFDTFVTGDPNKIAVAAAKRVAEYPGEPSFNPYFIYGRSGTGKTHLLLAIKNHINETQPELTVSYITSEKFSEDFIREIQIEKKRGSGQLVMQAYRNVDVLLIDDVQFLETREASLEFFFNTFNHLRDAGKQIVLSADRAPKDLKMNERMTSRFNEGLGAPINPPTIEMKIAILRALYRNVSVNDPWYNTTIDTSLLNYMAEISSSNVREIEGFFTTVMVFATDKLNAGETINQEDIRRIADDIFNITSRDVVKISTIQKVVAKGFDITYDEIIGSRRVKNINHARQVAMYLSRNMTEESLAAIGSKFGGRDHTTIMNGVRNIEEMIKSDRLFYDQIEQLKERIRNYSL